MLSLNLRANDTSTIWFGEPTWFELDGPKLTETQVAARINGKKCLVLCHGYNTKDAGDFYSRYLMHMGACYDEIIGLSAPLSKFGWAFWLATMRAGKAGRLLVEALSRFEPVVLDIQGHSLGCRVALEALDHGLKVRHAILAAAAVDNESIQKRQKYALAVQRVEGTMLVACSRHDKVLGRAYKLGMLDEALGHSGPQNLADCDSRIKVLDCSDYVNEHSGYRKCTMFFDAWRQIA
jgi:predicted alpha/beta hydrolase family esterase